MIGSTAVRMAYSLEYYQIMNINTGKWKNDISKWPHGSYGVTLMVKWGRGAGCWGTFQILLSSCMLKPEESSCYLQMSHIQIMIIPHYTVTGVSQVKATDKQQHYMDKNA